jgi:hypothetical protein
VSIPVTSTLANMPTCVHTGTLTNMAPYQLAIGGFCRVDSSSTYMYCPASDAKGILPEQFIVNVVGLPDGSIVLSSTPFTLKSLQTLQYCRVAPVGGRQQIRCNVDVASAASFTYSTAGFAYQGKGIVAPGNSQPLYIGSGANGTAGTAVPAGLSTCDDALTLLQTGSPSAPKALVSAGERYQLTLTKAGNLKITDRVTEACVWEIGPFSACKAPYAFELTPCGSLVLKQGNGSLVWSSSSCCMGSGCLTASLREDGTLVIADSLGQVVWSSSDYQARGKDAGKPAANMRQLQSNGHPRVSCLNASPLLPAVSLASSNTSSLLLQLSKAGSMQLRNRATGAISAKTAGSASTAAQLCLLSNGQLQLSSKPASGPVQSTWRSATLPASATRSAGSFTARLSSTGCVQVLDKVCNLVATECNVGSSSSGGSGGSSRPPPARMRARPGSPRVRTLPPPPIQAAANPSTQRPACKPVLAVGRVCGGISMCGADAPCDRVTGFCCESGTSCIRRSLYTWVCGV